MDATAPVGQGRCSDGPTLQISNQGGFAVSKERRLGRGLEALLGRAGDEQPAQLAELAIVENIQRKDLNAIEKAESFERYIHQYQCTQEELATRVQVDRSTIANLIRLLDLPAGVKQMVQEGEISQGHARALLPL